MFEPTETESKETIDEAVEILRAIVDTARTDPALVKSAPLTAPISRPDETLAARRPRVKY
jgi:glycine dehydrogenase subunit 2